MTSLNEIYRLGNYIDTFALGHYARVFSAHDVKNNRQVAFKVMRMEHLSDDGDIRWEFRAFPNEAELLIKLADSPHVVDLLDCGYLADHADVPSNQDIISFGRDVASFSRAMLDYAERNWRPYLVMPELSRVNNLFYQMKPTLQATRWRLPTEEGLVLAVQFAHVLQMAHRQNIVYMDHKLEHVYWDGVNLQIIDLNSSRQLDGQDKRSFQMDIHNLCVGILYPLFTGLSPVSGTLRPMPGNIDQVESRYQTVTSLDFGVEPTLSPVLKDLLNAGAAMQIATVEDFISQLQAVCHQHGWDFPNKSAEPASRRARDHMRDGLRRLREGEMKIREARDLFREAATLDDISDDLEAELRRLVKAINDMLNQRVIP
jgi:serine/threonine protein kinase